jgi:CDP-diacylglycerol--glycerol-3-phosphate 3-phosphatidyltransferase
MPYHSSAIRTWANLVTVTRLMVAPLMFWLIPDHRNGNWLAFGMWFVLCCSDKVDGVLARRHGTTTIGAYLDPLADKILILGAMFTLVSRDVYWIVPVVIIAVRELGISLYRTFVGSKGVSVPASRTAKLKTLTQQLSVGFAIAPLTARDAQWLWKGLLWIAVFLAVVSAAQYMWRAHTNPRVRELTTSDVGL